MTLQDVLKGMSLFHGARLRAALKKVSLSWGLLLDFFDRVLNGQLIRHLIILGKFFGISETRRWRLSIRNSWLTMFQCFLHCCIFGEGGRGSGARENRRRAGGGGTGDGRRKGGKRDLYDGGKRERKSKRQAFVNCYYSSSSQRNEPNNVS